MTNARRAPSVLLCAVLLLVGVAVVLSPAPADAATAGRCVQAAHRGFKDHAIENSLGSMRAAVYRHADYLEMDVQTTKDGQFVLMHDRTIDRTSRGTGRISDKTAAQLGRVRLNDGQHIPRLRAVLDMAKPSRTGVLIELKWVPQSRFDDLKRLVDDFGLSRVVVDSFSPWVTQRFHQQYPAGPDRPGRGAADQRRQGQVVRRRDAGLPPRDQRLARLAARGRRPGLRLEGRHRARLAALRGPGDDGDHRQGDRLRPLAGQGLLSPR